MVDDQSDLDKKYFIDPTVYNCPFCNRHNVVYEMWDYFKFDWSKEKECFAYLVQCSSCKKISMHLTYDEISKFRYYSDQTRTVHGFITDIDTDIDSKLFFSVPTSFFVIDSRISSIIRELITEAEGCLKMNYLTGASACTRKAIYELLIKEKAEGAHYEDKINSLKNKHQEVDPALFDILSNIQGMTSDKIHEQSWPKWDSPTLKFIIETLKTVLYDLYVIPQIKKDRFDKIQQLKENIQKEKKKI